METQTIYQETIKFAGHKHAEMNQLVPGTKLPYVVHLSNVAMEVYVAFQNSFDEKFDLNYALQLALLHDTIEDTHTTFEEIEHLFGIDVANGVAALTKNDLLPKDKKMEDSLNRIKALQKEVWLVKLADRITNLQKPPQHWTKEKIEIYRNEAVEILTELEGGNSYLELRLKNQISNFEQYILE
ncbi:MAG: metal dependent phosphohydrolase [Bacteroidetes bacterium]|nr:MAG: metal dependent phosphohydrolase [Bacteroidota bacterium]